MALSTTYGDGGMTTSTESAPYPTGGREDDFWRHLASKRMAPQGPAAPPPRRQSGPGRNLARGDKGPGPSERSPSGLDMAAEQAKLAELQAKTNPPPMRLISGAGIVPGFGLDVNRMNAFQRQAYLPNNSTNSAGEDVDAEARRRALNDADFSRFQQFSNAAPRGTL